jgi:TatD DNase family protein
VHPHEAREEGQRTPDRLVEAARHAKVVGIGETGLDFYYEHSPRAEQAESFRAHIAASRQTGLPLIVHTRDADAETGDILEEEYARGTFTGLIHCFSSGPEVARRALALGMYISISGIVTFKAAESLRAIVRDIPLDRLLVETDAPYLAPVPKRGKTNEPAFVAHTAAKVAELKGIASPSSRPRRPTTSSGCSAKAERVRRARDHPGLRHVGRRAAARRQGRDGEWGAPTRRSAQPPHALLDPGPGPAARPCWSIPRPTCAPSCWPPGRERSTAVIWSHEHADQVHGIDDLGPIPSAAARSRPGPTRDAPILQRASATSSRRRRGFYHALYDVRTIDGPFTAGGRSP